MIRGRKPVKRRPRLREGELSKVEHLARIGAWRWDPKRDEVTWSKELYRIAGRNPREPAPTYKEHPDLFTPDSWERLQCAVEETLRNGKPYELDLEMVRPDGTSRWIMAHGEAERDAKGRIRGLRGTARDITERSKIVDALRESEQRFRLVANSAPVLIWKAGTDKGCTYFNQPWLEFTGRPVEDELGYGWAKGVHPEDLSQCLETYNKAFDQHRPFRMEYRLRRYDGQYRWILDTGVPRFNTDGSFAGYIGSAVDISDRKKAAEALSSVNQRLIEAQEQERRRIARELHDDINQRLGLVAIDLQNMAKTVALDARDDLPNKISQLFNSIMEIAQDVQALSHRLHSSKLEVLGVVAAMRAFCQELSEQQKVKIKFTHEKMPDSMPEAISICLFRILQEGLLNAVRHSGVKRFEAHLESTENQVQLTIRDEGEGFDPEAVESNRGLGLVSMRERVALAGGTISITSKPKEGTEVRVRVRIPDAERRETRKADRRSSLATSTVASTRTR